MSIEPGRAAGRLLRHRLPPRITPRSPTGMPCRAASTTRASAATDFTACPTNTWPSACAPSRRRSRAGRVIVAHLGSGASMCALSDGRSIETTMGFTATGRPADGHAARPARPRRRALPDRAERHDRADEVSDLLYKESGLKGLSGLSNDMRDLLASEDPAAAFAIDHFVLSLRPSRGSARRRPGRPRRIRLHRRDRRELPSDPAAYRGPAGLARRRPGPSGERGGCRAHLDQGKSRRAARRPDGRGAHDRATNARASPGLLGRCPAWPRWFRIGSSREVSRGRLR